MVLSVVGKVYPDPWLLSQKIGEIKTQKEEIQREKSPRATRKAKKLASLGNFERLPSKERPLVSSFTALSQPHPGSTFA
jgi:hypothetical protein